MTNLQQLYELIKPVEIEQHWTTGDVTTLSVKWEEEAWRWEYRKEGHPDEPFFRDPENTTWKWGSEIAETEAHNHICIAAIEWLGQRVGGLWIGFDTPGCWEVTWDIAGEPEGAVSGPTLLDALLKAVEAVKEKD